MSAHDKIGHAHRCQPVLEHAAAFMAALNLHLPNLAADNTSSLTHLQIRAYTPSKAGQDKPSVLFQSGLATHGAGFAQARVDAKTMLDNVRWRLHILSAIQPSQGTLHCYQINNAIQTWNARSPEEALLLHVALGCNEQDAISILTGTSTPEISIRVDSTQAHLALMGLVGTTIPSAALAGCPLA